MKIRKLRLERGWSQEQLAAVTGLSVRTIQRVESGNNAGLETLNALAAAFEVELADLEPDALPDSGTEASDQLEKARKDVHAIRDFWAHLGLYLIIMAVSFGVNLLTSPDHLWVWWPALGWGIGIAFHALSVFEEQFLGQFWEQRQIRKRLDSDT